MARYRITANTLVVDEADTLAEATAKLRTAVRRWRQGDLFPRQRRVPSSRFTAVREDRDYTTDGYVTKIRDTGAWDKRWKLQERGAFSGYARVDRVPA